VSILVDRSTRVVVQGITGREGAFHAARCKEYGTTIVGGVTPGKGGTTHEGFPVWNTVAEAVASEGANCALIFVPPPAAADAIMEAAAAARHFLAGTSSQLIGPNCPGVITPEQAKIGIMPGHIHRAGPVGVVSRSGTLTYEVVGQLSGRGIGQTTCVGIGGDPVNGTSFVDVLRLFNDDPETRAIMMIGEGEETDRRVHLRPDGAAGAAHGPRRRDHRGRQGNGGGEDEGTRRCRGHAREEPGRHGSHHGQGDRTMTTQRTLAIIKPDAVAKGVVGQIITRIERAGLTILAAKLVHMTLAEARGFYIVHRERPFYDSLCAFMTQGPCLPMVLAGDDAIRKWRDLMGATDPAKAAAGTIRKDFASSIESNAVHGSDAPETAEFEVPYFFSSFEICPR
jgi:succinyl-CoA synthetase alpha subunit